MKKINLILFTLVISFVPFFKVEALRECSPSKLNEMRKNLADFTLNYELTPENTKIVNPYNQEKVDVSNQIKVTLGNLPEGYYAVLVSDGRSTSTLVNDSALYIDGGVYRVEVYSTSCSNQPIKQFEALIPIYNKDKKAEEKWFDGTYEQKSEPKKADKNSKIKIGLIITIVILLIMIIGTGFYLYKRRKTK